MKISQPDRTPPPRTTRATPRSGSFAPTPAPGAKAASDVAAPSGAAPAAPVSSVDAVLALQAIDDARARAIGYGEAVLDLLDALRLAVLEGRPPRAALIALEQTARQDPGAADDPQLQKVLDAVKVRTAVELAKHGASIT